MTESAFVRSTSALSRTVGPEVFLAAPDRDDVDRLSPTAGAVWGLLDRPRTISSLVDELSRAFDAPRERLAEDVEALLADLAGRGWVEVAPDA
jgi:pyrroloquinoline quinone biosynthesis protein D